MSNLTRALMMGAAGVSGDKVYVDDVFSTYLAVGAGGQTITNGIDLATEGGMVWSKARAAGAAHGLHDTERGVNKFLSTNSNNPQTDVSGNTSFHTLTSFNTDGFTTGNDGGYGVIDLNGYGSYAHWSFRKAPGFFDVVTWAGDGTSGRQIAHNLESVPGFIMIKSYVAGTGGTGWMCYHRSLGNTKAIRLDNGTAATSASSTYWNNTDPTSTHFTVGNQEDINGDYASYGRSYVAYVFAHDSAVFGTDADESIIKCGTYTGNGSTNGPTINLGFEPQWLMIKRSNSTGNWTIYDAMRGAGAPNQTTLEANQTTTEDINAVYNVDFQATGFQLKTSSATFNGSGDTFIYVAIRRPNKPPSAATEVFDTNLVTTGTPATTFTSGFVTDAIIYPFRTLGAGPRVSSRLTGNPYLDTSSGSGELATTTNWDSMTGLEINSSSGISLVDYMFRRAPGFFDVVAYTASNQVTQNIAHNLNAEPELMILKSRSSTNFWWTYVKDLGANKVLQLDDTAAVATSSTWLNNTAPTSSVFTVGSGGYANFSTGTYIAYLFATLAGISKVGTYSGTGNAINVDCGFSAGARFILIKRTDSTGDWYVYDTARGIVSGNDPYLLLNSSAAEVTNTDYIDPLSSGFTVTSSAPTGLNASGGTYIFLAIA